MSESQVIRCQHCGSIISLRRISLYTGMVKALWEVYKWCNAHNTHEFSRKEIKHLLKNDGQIARFGDWVMFGGIIYRPQTGKGFFGMNMHRATMFFAGAYSIPLSVLKNPITGEITPEDIGTLYNIPHLSAFLDENRMYMAEYQKPKQMEML